MLGKKEEEVYCRGAPKCQHLCVVRVCGSTTSPLLILCTNVQKEEHRWDCSIPDDAPVAPQSYSVVGESKRRGQELLRRCGTPKSLRIQTLGL